jgi:hypothetical protein
VPRLVEGGRERAGIREAVAGIGRERPRDDSIHCPRHVGSDRAWGRSPRGCLAGQQLEHERPHGEHVGACVDLGIVDLRRRPRRDLGCQSVADETSGLSGLPLDDGRRDAEPGDQRGSVGLDDDVVDPDPQMQHTAVVGKSQRVQNGHTDTNRDVGVERTIATKHLPRGLAIDVLADEEQDSVLLSGIEQSCDAPTRDLRHAFSLLEQARGERVVVAESRVDQRHRDVATEQSIASTHRRPRRAADELLLEDVSIGDDGRAVLRLHALSVCPAVFPTADARGLRAAARAAQTVSPGTPSPSM